MAYYAQFLFLDSETPTGELSERALRGDFTDLTGQEGGAFLADYYRARCFACWN